MATTAAERTLYPLSTRDADSIPLDVIDANGLMLVQMISGAASDIIIPDTYLIGFIWSEIGCFIQQLAVPSGGVFTVANPATGFSSASKDDTLFVPAQTLITVKWRPGQARIVSLAVGAQKVILQNTVKWNTLALSQQVNKK